MPRPFSWACRRRALARSSSIPRSEESSIHSGAASSLLQALTTLGQSPLATRPLRSRSPARRACEAMKRWASSISDISSENSATGFLPTRATFSAMLQTAADFPIAGLPASTIRFPGWKPPVMWSRSRKPAGTPVSEPSPAASASSLSISSERMSLISRKSAACSVWATPNSSRSACSTISEASPSRSATDCWIVLAAASRRRISEFCLTMKAWCLALPGAGTFAARLATTSLPPICSSAPCCWSVSVTVRTSTGSAFSFRRMIASKIERCRSR